MAGSLRRRLHVNSLITNPGTFEWEWSSQYDAGDTWLLPTTWKIVPADGDSFWARTEWSLSFDAVQNFRNTGNSITHASDHLGVAMTTALPDALGMQWALAPSVNFLLRTDTGARLGGAVFGKFERGVHSGGMQVAWTGATHVSDTNPAGTFDLGAGYGVRLGSSRWTPYANVLAERSTGQSTFLNFTEGIEFQATPQFAIDFNCQQQAVRSGSSQMILALGITWNLGPLRHGAVAKVRSFHQSTR